MNRFFDEGEFGPYMDYRPPVADVGEQAARYLGAQEPLDEIATTAVAGRDGVAGLHEVVLRIGSLMPSLFKLATGLETVTNPSWGAAAHRLGSMSLMVEAIAQGLVPLDDALVAELQQWPQFLAGDLDRALRHDGVLR